MPDEDGQMTEEERLRVQRPDHGRRLLTAVGVCLDESGSMGERDFEGGDKYEAALHAFNEYLASQQAADDCLMTLVKFKERAQVVYSGRPLADVPPLNRQTYLPSGGTALFDALAFCVEELERLSADRYVVVVLTDGEENRSRHTTREQVRTLLAAKEALGNWTFVYLSADPQAWQQAAAYGFTPGNVAVYAATAQGTQVGMSWVNQGMTQHRNSVALRSSAYFAGTGAPSGAAGHVNITDTNGAITS